MAHKVPKTAALLMLYEIADNGVAFAKMAKSHGRSLRSEVDFALSRLREISAWMRNDYNAATLQAFRSVWLAAYDGGVIGGHESARAVDLGQDPIFCG